MKLKDLILEQGVADKDMKAALKILKHGRNIEKKANDKGSLNFMY